MNIDFIKIINNYKNYNYFYKNLKELVLYIGDFTTLPSFFKITLAIFNLSIL
ncbi:hypothetical protein C8035_v005330 [Colletotrichum spinosum]|uniref:Uncharacterized protein n=1 Tax=Colletotrichum spinosum TaxID=1347390 RepID=A0A4R8PX90_9PEZI|nr:hypothetical protein C8035_v005330 [Colletotrichum spinosum]